MKFLKIDSPLQWVRYDDIRTVVIESHEEEERLSNKVYVWLTLAPSGSRLLWKNCKGIPQAQKAVTELLRLLQGGES